MAFLFRIKAMLLLVAIISATARAQDTPRSVGYESIENLFAAYRTARNKGDWRTLFALGTDANRNEIITAIALSPRVASDPQLKAILKKHGLDWNEFNRQLGGVLSADKLDKLNDAEIGNVTKKASNIVRSADFDKTGLYAAAQEHFSKSGDFWDFTVHELRKVKHNGSVATGRAVTTHFTKVRTTGPGVAPHERTTKISGSEALHFRRIEGRWYLGD